MKTKVSNLGLFCLEHMKAKNRCDCQGKETRAQGLILSDINISGACRGRSTADRGHDKRSRSVLGEEEFQGRDTQTAGKLGRLGLRTGNCGQVCFSMNEKGRRLQGEKGVLRK